MTSLFIVLIFLFASISLISYLYCWQDVKSGRPYILSLRQITMVMDRQKLNAMFGQPKPGYYYELSPAMLTALLHRRRMFVYRECFTDGLCIFGAWYFMSTEAALVIKLAYILLAGGAQTINLMYSVRLIHQWGDQIREEIDNSED